MNNDKFRVLGYRSSRERGREGGEGEKGEKGDGEEREMMKGEKIG